jgi:long-chain fatty acid transport protein
MNIANGRSPRRLTSRIAHLASIILAAALIAALSPLQLAAQDFSFHEPSARAAALGGAFTARADDATALFYNPAGLAFLNTVRIKCNIMFGRRQTGAAWPDGGASFTTQPPEFIGNVAVSFQPVKHITIGAGLFSPFTYESYWTPGWDAETLIGRNRLRTMTFRAALAVEPLKGLALGAGVDLVSSTVRWRHSISFNIPNYPLPRDLNVDSNYELSGRGTSFVAGALWKILPAVQIGAKYQERLPLDYTGTDVFNSQLDISGMTVPDPHLTSRKVIDLVGFYYKTQNVTTRLTLPRQITGGLALTPLKPLSLYLDLEWSRWSEFGNWIFTSMNEGQALNPAFTTEYQDFYGLALNYGVQGIPLTLRDTKAVKAGLEYRPGKYTAVRAGYARHQSSVDAADRTPIYPDLDRNVYSLGFGYEGPLFSIWGDGERVSDLSFDFFIRYATGGPSASAYPGFEMTYDSSRFVFGFGAGFIF